MRGETKEQPHHRLSDREFKIFEMLIAGKRGADIARELCLSRKTVSTHKTNVLKKLNLSTGNELIYYAIDHRLATRA